MENKNFENKILNNVKLNIAMSEFGKEYTIKEKKRINCTTKKVAVILLVLLVVTSLGVQAKKIFDSFVDKEVTASVSILDAINNGYAEKIQMDYIYSDEIGLKVNSLFMTDNDINFVLDFKLNDKVDLEGNYVSYSYILYNENNEVYNFHDITGKDLALEFIKENNLKIDKENLSKYLKYANSQPITHTPYNYISSELLNAKETFLRAKKLYIKVVGIGYIKEENGEYKGYKSISNSNWLIELDIPDKFYENSVIQYELKEPNKGVNINYLFISDSSMTLIANINGINSNDKICIVDDKGNEYKTNILYFIGDRLSVNFPINKNMIPNKMYLKTNVNNKEKLFELVRKDNNI